MSFDEPFDPRNHLEQQLIAAQEGSIPGDDFMQYLLTAQLFMPVQDEKHVIKGFQRDDKAVPLTLETEDGMQAWMEEWVYGPGSFQAYLAKVGRSRLDRITADPKLCYSPTIKRRLDRLDEVG